MIQAQAFGHRLAAVFAGRGPLCVGIDPHAWLLHEWGLPDSAAGAEEFGRRVVEAAAGSAGIVKPQVAFFERFGSAGFAALERVLADARDAGLLSIADAKRGDLGTTMAGYGQAWLTAGSPLEADALTVSTYMGVGSLGPAIELAVAAGKGLFLLAATSNPEAAVLQRAVVQDGPAAGLTVAGAVLADVAERNRAASAACAVPIGSLGVVLGATLDLATFGVDVRAAPSAPFTPVLAPGFGHQGADVAQLSELFGAYAPAVIVSESRSVLAAGPGRIRDAIARRADEVRTTASTPATPTPPAPTARHAPTAPPPAPSTPTPGGPRA
ncbi:orotidine-5'-phosphate decarboxylase [Glaciibacter sp. 2TAF33]|uniref:orotidine-5'-phosphate decarboxylase n=1 Tax=Glaciibacter sp. 2TAF33 TaxID=3233015 RepID=UPI003F924DF2